MRIIEGLEAALKVEAIEQANISSMQRRIESANEVKVAALARRQAVVAAIAAGGSDAEIAEIDETVRRSESIASVLTEAALLAEARLRDAESATTVLLRQEAGRMLEVASEGFRKAEQAFVEATNARYAADQRKREAERAFNLRADTLRRYFGVIDHAVQA
jgi:hypothetical protein